MIRTETAKKYGGTKAIPLTEFSFIVPEKKYIIQDAEIDGNKCIIITEEKDAKKFKLEEIREHMKLVSKEDVR